MNDNQTKLSARYISVADAATYSGLGDPTIRRFLSEGALKAYRPVPGRVLVDAVELEALIQASVGRPCTRGAHLQAKNAAK